MMSSLNCEHCNGNLRFAAYDVTFDDGNGFVFKCDKCNKYSVGCVFCTGDITAYGPAGNGTAYCCERCRHYSIRNDDKHYFRGLTKVEKSWYVNKLKEIKQSGYRETYDLHNLIPDSPKQHSIVGNIGSDVAVLGLSINDKGEYDWVLTPYNQNTHGQI